jgi:hypothetical protein
MTQADIDPPIQNLGAFDILGVRKDGGIDAAIVAATAIDGSTETLRSLTTKVRNYVTELTSPEFLTQHPAAPGSTRSVIMAHSTIDVVARGLIESLSRETRAAGVELATEYVVA